MKKIGVVGCGNISGIYLSNIGTRFTNIQIAGICDLIREKAENRSREFGGLRIYKDMYEIFADPEVDIVLNITRPYDHYGVTKAALLAGKSVYSEKPLAASLEEGKEIMALAKEKGLMVGGAPVDEAFCRRIGADCYTEDAASAADAAAAFCAEMLAS